MTMKKAFAKHALFPLVNRRNGIAAHLRELEVSQWFSASQIHDIQWNKLQGLLSHAYSNVPYYRDLFEKEGLKPSDVGSFSDFHRIPTLQRKDINENIDRMISTGAVKNRLIRKTTSGSTGEPVTIFRDEHSANIASASGLRFRRWAGHDIGVKTARIWGRVIDLDQGAATKNDDSSALSLSSMKTLVQKKAGEFLDPRISLISFEAMTDEIMEEFFLKIKRQRIEFLVGYMSAVYFFSEFVNRHHRREIKLKGVRTIAEVLHEHQRKSMEAAFQCQIYNVYGTREFEIIAAGCSSQRGLHINAENLYVEIIDSESEPVRNGEYGQVAITDLNNYGMPLIRYLIGDRAALTGTACSCGRGLPLLEEIEGRVIDMISLSDGTLLHGSLFVGFMWNFTDEVERFRVVQHKIGEMELYLKLSKPFTAERFEFMKRNLHDIMHNKMSVEYKMVEELPIDSNGKFKHIVSYLNTDSVDGRDKA